MAVEVADFAALQALGALPLAADVTSAIALEHSRIINAKFVQPQGYSWLSPGRPAKSLVQVWPDSEERHETVGSG